MRPNSTMVRENVVSVILDRKPPVGVGPGCDRQSLQNLQQRMFQDRVMILLLFTSFFGSWAGGQACFCLFVGASIPAHHTGKISQSAANPKLQDGFKFLLIKNRVFVSGLRARLQDIPVLLQIRWGLRSKRNQAAAELTEVARLF